MSNNTTDNEVFLDCLFQQVHCTKNLGGSCLRNLAPLDRHPGVSLGQMVGELLKRQDKKPVNTTSPTSLTFLQQI